MDVWIYQGTTAGDWSTPANWYLNRVPGANDIAYFGYIYDPYTHRDVGSSSDCTENVSGGATVAQLEMDSTYGGTLTPKAPLNPGDLIMAGGTISQPNGASSKIFTGTLDWTDGFINDSGSTSTLEIGGTVGIVSYADQSASDTEDNFIVDSGVTLAFMQTLTTGVSFLDGAGLTVNGGTVWVYHNTSSHVISIDIDEVGNAAINNNGGTFQDATAQGVGSANPVLLYAAYIDNNGTLNVNAGTMRFEGQATSQGNSASVFLNTGTVNLTAGTTLQADVAYIQQGGTLYTIGAGTVHLNGGPVVVSGGAVKLDALSPDGKLVCQGNVSVSGGTYYVWIDGGTLTSTDWQCDGTFAISGTASLNVYTSDIPPSWVPNGPPSAVEICYGASGLTNAATQQNLWPGGDNYNNTWSYNNPGFEISEYQDGSASGQLH